MPEEIWFERLANLDVPRNISLGSIQYKVVHQICNIQAMEKLNEVHPTVIHSQRTKHCNEAIGRLQERGRVHPLITYGDICE